MPPVAFKVVAHPQVSTPYLGPTEMERRRGRPYRARLGANECLFGPSPEALTVMKAYASRMMFYSDATHRKLRHALALHWNVPAEGILVGSGIEALLDLFVRA